MNRLFSDKDSTLKQVAVITVVIVVLLAALIVIFNKDAIFGLVGGNELDTEPQGQSIPDFRTSGSEDKDVRTVNYDDLSKTERINLKDYSADFTITTMSGTKQNYTTYRVTKYKGKLLAVSEFKKVLYEDHMLYVNSDLYSFETEAEEADFYREIGITPVEELIELMENGVGIVEATEKTMVLTYIDPEDSRKRSMFEITVENGIVTYEIDYFDNRAYKTVSTSNIDNLITTVLEDSYFDIN